MDKKTREMAMAEIRVMVEKEAEEIRTEMAGISWDLIALEARMSAWARGSAALQGRKSEKRD